MYNPFGGVLDRLRRPILWKGLVGLLLGLFVIGEWGTAKGEEQTIYVIHVNDTHGRTLSDRYPRVFSAIMETYATHGRDNCVVVHSGDVLSRGSAYVAKTRGLGELAFWSGLSDDPARNIGCEAWTPGNGDFYGLGDGQWYNEYPGGTANAQWLVDYFTAHGGTALLANYVSSTDRGQRAIDGSEAYSIVEVGGLHVGFVGLTYMHPGQQSAATNALSHYYNAWLREASKAAVAAGAQIVVPTTHVGYDWGESRMAAQTQGFPALLGAHDHMQKEGTTILRGGSKEQASYGEAFRYDTVVYGNTGFGLDDGDTFHGHEPAGEALGILAMTVDTETGEVVRTTYQFKALPGYYGDTPELDADLVAYQKTCEEDLEAWIDANVNNPEFIQAWGPLSYADLDSEWPSTSSTGTPAPVASVAPLRIQGETLVVGGTQITLPGQDVFVNRDGAVEVVGARAYWDTFGGELYLGDDGYGSLSVLDSAWAFGNNVTLGTSPEVTGGGIGGINVIGDGSSLGVMSELVIGGGNGGVGYLNVFDGAFVDVSGSSVIGRDVNSSGTVQVGDRSSWYSGNLVIGDAGIAAMLLVDGGYVGSDSVVVGKSAGGRGDVIVAGVDSYWEIGNAAFDDLDACDLYLGVEGGGSASLSIADGGQVVVDGDVSVKAGTQLSFGITGNSVDCMLDATGEIGIDGDVAMDVVVDSVARRRTILVRGGSIAGGVAAYRMEDRLPLLDFAVDDGSDPNQIALVARRSALRMADFGSDGNASRIGASLDRALADAVDEPLRAEGQAWRNTTFSPLLVSMVSSEAAPETAVDTLVPWTAAVPSYLARENGLRYFRFMADQLMSPVDSAASDTGSSRLTVPSAPLPMGYGGFPASDYRVSTPESEAAVVRSQDDEGHATWGSTYGYYGDHLGGYERPGFSYQSAGFIAGVHSERMGEGRFGWSVSYDHQRFGLFNELGNGDIDTLRFGPYLSRQSDSHRFCTALSSGIHWGETTRGTAFGLVSAAPVDSDISWAAAYGYCFRGGGWNWMPTAALYYTIVLNDPYLESNAAAGAMRLQGNDPQSLRTSVGGRIEYSPRNGSPWVLSGGAGWMHDYLNARQDFAGQFVGQDDAFVVAFGPTERDTALFDLGTRVTTSNGCTVSLQYFCFFSSGRQDHGGSLAAVFPY